MAEASVTAPPLVDRTTPDRAVPLLLTGPSAAVVMAADGELSFPRETRGGLLDWGGVYGQGIRLIGPSRLIVTVEGQRYELPPTLARLTARRSEVRSEHRMGPLRLVQEVRVLPRGPVAVRRLSFSADAPTSLEVGFEFVPFLAPVLIEGIKPYDYSVRRTTSGWWIESHSLGCAFESRPNPVALAADGGADLVDGFHGELGTITARWQLEVLPGAPTALDAAIWGGLATTLTRDPGFGHRVLDDGGRWADEVEAPWRDWWATTPEVAFPNDPALESAYGLARDALRTLYTSPIAGIVGLVAGYPWYSSLWLRDMAWMLPAVLWLGDYDRAEAAIATALRYQAESKIPLLGAETGELPMQISPGPLFLYGTSDTTLYYPGVARQLIAHSGRSNLLRTWSKQLQRIGEWIRSRTDPTNGLFLNGGEVAEIRLASSMVGAVHFGFDAQDTTIWDSTDRRDHAIDVQVLSAQAMAALAEMGNLGGTPTDGADWAARARSLAAQVALRYRWPEESYLVDSLKRTGEPVRKLRPNALRAVSAGFLDLPSARSIVDRAFQEDLLTDWGMRTLSSRDPGYDPQAYHDGQVWTIATAWAADAAFAVGDTTRGLAALRLIAERVRSENGLANECYRGDRDAPYDSCFLLGFSVAPFLTTIFERLWGLSFDLPNDRVRVVPGFPSDWTSASLRRLRFGAGRLDLAWEPAHLRIEWSGPRPISLHGPNGSISLPGPGTGTLSLAPPPQRS
jgi:hypothetical protein